MNSTNSKRPIQCRRRFHDTWAFLLFTILLMGNIVYIALSTDKLLEITFINIKYITILVTTVLSFITLNLLGFRLCPCFYLKLTFLSLPPLLICISIYNFNKLYVTLSFILLILWGITTLTHWSNLNIVSSVLSYSTEIICQNFPSMCAGCLICSIFQFIHLYVIYSFNIFDLIEKGSVSKGFLPIYFLYIFWSFFNLYYFHRAYITSLVAFHFVCKNDKSLNLIKMALINCIYMIGSISYAGLLATLGIFSFFIRGTCILTNGCQGFNSDFTFSDKLTTNEHTIPYIAIHGGKYLSSHERSSEITRISPKCLCGSSAFNITMGISTILVILICRITDFLFKLSNNKLSSDFKLVNRLSICFYFTNMASLSSVFYSLKYLYIHDPKFIDERFKEEVKKFSS